MPVSRREFVTAALALPGASPLSSVVAAAPQAATPAEPQLVIFSKHLHWARWQEMAEFARESGFDGVDLTVRKGGHVQPERVAEDLPAAFEAVRKAGLSMPMITTGIVDAASPHAAPILQAAHSLGISRYRWGGFAYRAGVPIPEQLAALRERVQALVQLNRQYQMTAMYHIHSGFGFGAPVWDLWEVLRDADIRHVGVNYDVAHATIEGGYGGWVRSLELTAPMMHGVALKDFRWARNAQGEWRPRWCPAGQGMVNFPRFFKMLKQSGFRGPLQVHFEFEGLGGADTGKAALSIPKREYLAILRREVEYFRARMQEAATAGA
jgi:sugar phosphate isomerase/epimerase